ncbi:DUF4238 domain-containing protein [uncultured Pontibacter sp.]|uniref:DUF4238 domain-containing protein n=1 Tax=uncultured Pontibacter sp. TaxID=453356 RepID=UPI00343B6369
MYFRTPKVLNRFVAFAAELVEQVMKDSEANTVEFLGYKIDTSEKSFTEIKKEIKETNRVDYIKTQLALLNEFVKFKALDGLVVIELIGDQEFITSDNPVEISNSLGDGFNLFDARNSIYVPLDPKHALFIAPKKEEAIINMVFYHKDDFFQHVVLNNSVFENAERWIIGTSTGVDKFLIDHEEYGKPATDNHPIINKFKEKIQLLGTMALLTEKGVTNNNHELVDFMKNLKHHKLYEESIDLQHTYNQMKAMGLDI